MNTMQELRGQVRQLLSDTLLSSAEHANANAAIYREILDLLSKVND